MLWVQASSEGVGVLVIVVLYFQLSKRLVTLFVMVAGKM